MYSMFSEMMRLIPPEKSDSDPAERHNASARRENEHDSDLDESRISDQHSRLSRDEQQDTKDTTTVQEDGAGSEPCDLSTPNLSINPAAGNQGGLFNQSHGNVHSDFSLGELDALLRF